VDREIEARDAFASLHADYSDDSLGRDQSEETTGACHRNKRNTVIRIIYKLSNLEYLTVYIPVYYAVEGRTIPPSRSRFTFFDRFQPPSLIFAASEMAAVAPILFLRLS